MNNSEKKLFNEEEVINYLFMPYLESLNKVCEYAASDPEITRIAVLCIDESCIDIAVWLTDASEENCDRHGLGIYRADENHRIFARWFYHSEVAPDRGLIVYEKQ